MLVFRVDIRRFSVVALRTRRSLGFYTGIYVVYVPVSIRAYGKNGAYCAQRGTPCILPVYEPVLVFPYIWRVSLRSSGRIFSDLVVNNPEPCIRIYNRCNACGASCLDPGVHFPYKPVTGIRVYMRRSSRVSLRASDIGRFGPGAVFFLINVACQGIKEKVQIRSCFRCGLRCLYKPAASCQERIALRPVSGGRAHLEIHIPYLGRIGRGIHIINKSGSLGIEI